MKIIPLTRGYAVMVDDEDYESMSSRKWYAKPCDNSVYAESRAGKMHRILLDAPIGVEVDHIDGNGLNNQRSNLRFATPQQNGANRGLDADSTSGFKGVSLVPSRRRDGTGTWRAQIRVDGRRYSLGCYPTRQLAAAAHDAAAVRFFGAYAKTNAMMGLLA